MRHFVGGFGAGWALAFCVNALVVAVTGCNTNATGRMNCAVGVMCGLAAWGLLP